MVLLLQEIVQIHRLLEEVIDLLQEEKDHRHQEGKEFLLLEVEIYQQMEEVKQVLDRMTLTEEKMTDEIEEGKEIVAGGEETTILVGSGIMTDKIENAFYC